VLENCFVIQMNDSLFDSRAVDVEADKIVVVEERISILEKVIIPFTNPAWNYRAAGRHLSLGWWRPPFPQR